MNARILVVVAVVVAASPAAAQLDDDWSIYDDAFGNGGASDVFSVTGASSKSPTFDLYPNLVGSGPSLLPTSLGTTGATLVVDCDSRNASVATSLACTTGGTWPIVENGAGTMALKEAPYTEPAARALEWSGAAADFFGAPNSSLGDVATGDFAVEVLFRAASASSAKGLVGKKGDATAATAGWVLRCSSAACANISLLASDGTTQVTVNAAASNASYDVLCFFKANTASGAQCFANAIAGAAVGTTTVGSLTNAVTMAYGSFSTGNSNNWTDRIDAMKMWSCSGCLNTANYQSIANEHFAAVTGVKARIAAGGATPTIMTRASDAFLDIDRDGDGNRRLFAVGPGWIRVNARRDSGNTLRKGIYVEQTGTNSALQSSAMNTTWAATNLAVTANTTASPAMSDASITGDTLESTDAAGPVEHFVRQAITLTANTWCMSAYYVPQSGRHLWLRNATIANGVAWFSPTGTVGTKQAGITVSNIDGTYVGGWVRAYACFTGTAAAHNIDVGFSNADNVTTYDDGTNATADAIVWDVVVEATVNATATWPTSPIVTTTATVTRVADDLAYAGTGSIASNAAGTIYSEVIWPGAMGNADRVPWIVDDGSGSNFIELDAFSGGLSAVGSGGLLLSVGAGPEDNARHTVRLLVATNNTRGNMDGGASGSDTSHTLPTGINKIEVGDLGAGGGANMQGLLLRLTVFPFETTSLP